MVARQPCACGAQCSIHLLIIIYLLHEGDAGKRRHHTEYDISGCPPARTACIWARCPPLHSLMLVRGAHMLEQPPRSIKEKQNCQQIITGPIQQYNKALFSLVWLASGNAGGLAAQRPGPVDAVGVPPDVQPAPGGRARAAPAAVPPRRLQGRAAALAGGGVAAA